jgi:hypothetical protein
MLLLSTECNLFLYKMVQNLMTKEDLETDSGEAVSSDSSNT